MKKYFAFVLLMFTYSISAYGISKTETVPVVVDLLTHRLNSDSNRERSMDFVIIEACAYTNPGLVEVTLFNIGNASVNLINSNGQVVSSEYVQTDTPTVVYLDTFFTSGTYYIEIVSDTWYAEGVVTF